jgi:hypothetical protein
MSSTPDPQALRTQLQAEHQRLSSAVTLQSARDTLQSAARQRDALDQAAQKLANAHYPHSAAVNAQVNALTAAFGPLSESAAHIIETAAPRLQAELAQSVRAIELALGGNDALLQPCLDALSALDERVKLAHSQVEAALSPFNSPRYDLEDLLRKLTWSMAQWAEFSGDRAGSGSLYIACEAEWVQTGRGGDDPDGVLYLTDARLVFEQKEKKNKTLGMFGGKLVQEVEFSIPLTDITGVRTKNEGLLGGKDILFIELASGDPARELKIEVKGGANNKTWAAHLERAKAGQFVADAPALPVPPVPDLSAWQGDLPASPAVAAGLAAAGGALASMMAGMKSVQHTPDAPSKASGATPAGKGAEQPAANAGGVLGQAWGQAKGEAAGKPSGDLNALQQQPPAAGKGKTDKAAQTGTDDDTPTGKGKTEKP